MPASRKMPATIERSSPKAQRTWRKAHDRAVETYGEGERARRSRSETFGGVDVRGSTRQELYERARRAGIAGRSKMSKKELARAVARKSA